MLEQALVLIAQGVASVDALAEKLGVPVPLARQFLTDLARLGYLRPACAGQCSRGCQGCATAAGCSGLPPMWSLTEKGKRLAAAA